MNCQHEGCYKPAIRFLKLFDRYTYSTFRSSSNGLRWIADCGNHRIYSKHRLQHPYNDEESWVAAQVEELL